MNWKFLLTIGGIVVIVGLGIWFWPWFCCPSTPNITGNYIGAGSTVRINCQGAEETRGYNVSLAMSGQPEVNTGTASITLVNTLISTPQALKIVIDAPSLTVSPAGHMNGMVTYRLCHSIAISSACTSALADEGGGGFLAGTYYNNTVGLQFVAAKTTPSLGCHFYGSILAMAPPAPPVPPMP